MPETIELPTSVRERALAPRGRGHPSKYTPERVQKILERLAAGNTRRAASLASGVSLSTFSLWLTEYSDFSESVERAESEAESVHVQNILRAASTGSHHRHGCREVRPTSR